MLREAGVIALAGAVGIGLLGWGGYEGVSKLKEKPRTWAEPNAEAAVSACNIEQITHNAGGFTLKMAIQESSPGEVITTTFGPIDNDREIVSTGRIVVRKKGEPILEYTAVPSEAYTFTVAQLPEGQHTFEVGRRHDVFDNTGIGPWRPLENPGVETAHCGNISLTVHDKAIQQAAITTG